MTSNWRARYRRRIGQQHEFEHSTSHPVIDLMPEQRDIADMGGTMRLGTYPCVLVPGTRTQPLWHSPHRRTPRHRFEFNNAYRDLLTQNGLVISGLSRMGGSWKSSRSPITRSWSARNSTRVQEPP